MVKGKIRKADRAKYLAFVEYDPRDGEVKIDRGYVTRDGQGQEEQAPSGALGSRSNS